MGEKQYKGSTVRNAAHEKKNELITERKESYCVRNVVVGEAKRAINEGKQQSEEVKIRRGFEDRRKLSINDVEEPEGTHGLTD